MFGPYQAAMMKQRDDLFRDGIDSGDIWASVTVAAMTRPRKIVELRLTPVQTGGNVLKAQGFKRRQRIQETAILTAPTGTLTDLLT
jgi:hypothetical protein